MSQVTARQAWRYLSRSDASAARFLSTYRRPPRTRVCTGPALYQEILLSKIGEFHAKAAGEIHRDVVDDWGRSSIRRTFRALRALVDGGLIVRRDDGYVRTRRAA